MSRINVITSTAIAEITGIDKYGSDYSRTRSATITSESSDRSDISVTPVVNGFRAPLPYRALVSSSSAGFAGLTVEYLIGKAPCRLTLSGACARTSGILHPPLPKALISSGEESRIVIDMLRRVGSQKWNAATALAEMNESLGMIGDSARTLSRAMFCAMRKDWRGLANVLKVKPKKFGKNSKDTASGWLAYQFGWAPLVDDIAQAALFLSGHTRQDEPIVMASGKLRYRESSQEESSYAEYGPDSASIASVFVTKTTFSDEYKASIYYGLNADYFRGLAKYGFIGVSTPWNLVPMSFLADWIVPIGDYLEAMDATVGLTYKGGSYTRFKKTLCTRKQISANAGPWPVTKVSGAITWPEVERIDMVRTVWPNSPLPFPAYIKNPFSVWRAVTGAALLRQFQSR